MMGPPSVPLTPSKGFKTRIVKCLIEFTLDQDESNLDSWKVKATTRFKNKGVPEEDLDENSIGLLAIPDGLQTSQSQQPSSFHPFIITKETGSRFYGSSLIVWQKDERQKAYVSKGLCLVSTIPFVNGDQTSLDVLP